MSAAWWSFDRDSAVSSAIINNAARASAIGRLGRVLPSNRRESERAAQSRRWVLADGGHRSGTPSPPHHA
jgi:hypothetical protein